MSLAVEVRMFLANMQAHHADIHPEETAIFSSLQKIFQTLPHLVQEVLHGPGKAEGAEEDPRQGTGL